MPAHIPKTGEKCADLWKGHRSEYRMNAYEEISKNGKRRKRYDDVKLLMRTLATHPDLNTVTNKGSEEHATHYFFNYKLNFKLGESPWKNQAHHLLPQEFWNGLTAAQMGLLEQIKYSINNGHNLIYLPVMPDGHLIHELPIHNGPHDSYNVEVINDATDVRAKLLKAEKEGEFCETTNPPKAILKRLKELQDKYWKILATTKVKKVTDLFPIEKSFSK